MKCILKQRDYPTQGSSLQGVVVSTVSFLISLVSFNLSLKLYHLYLFRGGRLIGMRKSTADVEQGEVANKFGLEVKGRSIADNEIQRLAFHHSSKR